MTADETMVDPCEKCGSTMRPVLGEGSLWGLYCTECESPRVVVRAGAESKNPRALMVVFMRLRQAGTPRGAAGVIAWHLAGDEEPEASVAAEAYSWRDPEVQMRWVANDLPVEYRDGEEFADVAHRALRQDATDEERAGVAESVYLDKLGSVRNLRKRSTVVVRCADCSGRVIAQVTPVDGRPMLWVSSRLTDGQRRWLDRTMTSGVAADCRTGTHWLDIKDLRALSPAQSAIPARQVRVSHALPVYSMRLHLGHHVEPER